VTERHPQSGPKATGRLLTRVFGAAGEQARGVHDDAEYQRLYRAGVRADSRGHALLIWQDPPRNGIPFRPYVYRGTGYDIYEDEDVAS
jgi:hypothetical protein